MDTDVLANTDPRVIGSALQEARKRKRLTQEDAARVISVGRTTLVAIEKGERRPRPSELQKLAQAYDRQISDFLRPRTRIPAFRGVQFRGPWRRTLADDDRIAEYVDRFEDLCLDYREIEELTNSPLTMRYPPEYDIEGLATTRAAEAVAGAERSRLGLGEGPIPSLRDVLENDVGLRVFFMELPAGFSAMYVYAEELGACIAVNGIHPAERQNMSMAHDYGHFLTSRYRSSIDRESEYQRLPESERFASNFALHFLMPAAGLTRRFLDVREERSKVTPADLCVLANQYGVSFEGMTGRLEDLGLLPVGTFHRVRDSGFKIQKAYEQLGLPVRPKSTLLPVRYQHLAIEAMSAGVITEGRFARLLRIDRSDAGRVAGELAVKSMEEIPPTTHRITT